MICKIFSAAFTIIFVLHLSAQNKSGIVSGPMLGQVELRDAKIWLEVSPDVKSIGLQLQEKNSEAKKAKIISYKGNLGNDFNPVQFVIGGLNFNTTYEYKILVNGKVWNKRRPTW